MKIAILTDSTSYMPEEVRKNLNVRMIPLSVVFGEESFREEIDITVDEFYAKVREGGELPKTSQPSTGDFLELFKELAKEGYDAVIGIYLSSGISGTYQGAIAAGGMVDDIEVHSFDSEISCSLQGFYVTEAAQMAAEGKSAEEILNRLKEMKKTLRAYFVVEDLMHLQRGGRLKKSQAIIGSLLQVKPILHFEDTFIVPFEKIRTYKRATNRIFELFDEVASAGKPMKVTVIHANALERAEEIKARVEEAYPNLDVAIDYFGPVVGTHLGEGSVGLGWYVI